MSDFLTLFGIYFGIIGFIAVYFTFPEARRRSRWVTIIFLLIGSLASIVFLILSFSIADPRGGVKLFAIAGVILLIILLWALYVAFPPPIKNDPLLIINERLQKLFVAHNGTLLDWITEIFLKVPLVISGKKVRTSLTTNDVLKSVIENLVLTFEETGVTDRIQISVLEALPDGHFATVVTNDAFDPSMLDGMNKFTWNGEGNGIAGRCVAINSSILCSNLQADPPCQSANYWIPARPNDPKRGGIIAVPIPFPTHYTSPEVKCLGVISISCVQPDIFNSDHVTILSQEYFVKSIQVIIMLNRLSRSIGLN